MAHRPVFLCVATACSVLSTLPSLVGLQHGKASLLSLLAIQEVGKNIGADQGQHFPIPKPVDEKIRDVMQRVYTTWLDSTDRRRYPPANLYGPVRRFDAPEQRTLYIFHLLLPDGEPEYFPILFDSATRRVTPDPPYLSGRWADLGIVGEAVGVPPVSFDDIDGDGHAEVVLEQICHNGSFYNAVVRHYYHVTSDLGLRQVLWFESRAIDPLGADGGRAIARTLTKLGPDSLRVDVFLEPSKRKVGEAILASREPGSPFHLVERRMFDRAYDAGLISASRFDDNTDEDEFVKHGYRFCAAP